MKIQKQPASSKSRIFIVEDHPVFRDGMVRLLTAEKNFEVCGQAADVEKGLLAIKQLKPDLVLVDLELPGKSGLDLIKEVRASKLPVKLLVVSMYDEALYADRVLRAGGDGYIMKEESPDEIIHAIRDVLGGHIYVSEDVMAGKLKASAKPDAKPETLPLAQLTDLELNVLELLGQGKNNKEIAEKLELPAKEIAGHCREIRKKLKLKTENALIRCAVCWVETGTM